MKIFHRDKYQFEGIVVNPLDNKSYFAFKCIKSNFTPEFVLVDEAKMLYNETESVYFEKRDLVQVDQSLSCVKSDVVDVMNLAVNESKWRLRRRRSNVNR